MIDNMLAVAPYMAGIAVVALALFGIACLVARGRWPV